jgi:hypothetical protein
MEVIQTRSDHIDLERKLAKVGIDRYLDVYETDLSFARNATLSYHSYGSGLRTYSNSLMSKYCTGSFPPSPLC